MDKLTMNVEEAAAALGVGRGAAYAAIREGRWPTRVIVVGRRYLIPRAAIAELTGSAGPPESPPPPTGPRRFG